MLKVMGEAGDQPLPLTLDIGAQFNVISLGAARMLRVTIVPGKVIFKRVDGGAQAPYPAFTSVSTPALHRHP